MQQHLRVHIAAVGHDQAERITKPLTELRADKVFLATHLNDSQIAKGILRQVKSTVTSELPNTVIQEFRVDLWSLDSCIKKFSEVFARELGNHRYVNVSTGSKPVAIAGMLACMLWGGSPYYTVLDYGRTPPRVMNTVFLPAYSIRKPEPELMQVVQVLAESGGKMSKKELISILQEPKLGLIREYSEQNSKTAPHSKLRVYLNPLEQVWGFVETKAKGSRSEVTLTEKGWQALQVFRVPLGPPEALDQNRAS